MGRAERVAFFATLSAFGAWLMFGPAIANPALQDARCFDNPWAHTYSFFPAPLDNLVCYANTIFKSLSLSEPSLVLADSFARWVYAAAMIVSCETMRTGQPSIVRQGLCFLYFAQVFTGAVVMPIYFGVLCWCGSKHNPPKAPITPERAWAVLLSLAACYLLPSHYVRASSWSYDSLLIWQAFPLYLIVLQSLLPAILRPLLGKTPASFPLLVLGAIALGLSISGQYVSLQSGSTFKQIYLPWFDRKTAEFSTAVHIFFVDDYVVCVLALASYLVLAYGGHGMRSKAIFAIALLVMTILAGPGGAAAALWTYRAIAPPEQGKVDEKRKL